MFRVKEKEKQGMRFEYELEDKTIIISIAYLTDKELSKVTGKSQNITWENHQKKEVLDDAKFKKNLVKSVLLDIEGATVKDLEMLIEPNLELEYDGDTDTPLKVNKDVIDLLAERTHYRFARFIFEKAREVTDFLKKKEKEDTENLGPGSDGIREYNSAMSS